MLKTSYIGKFKEDSRYNTHEFDRKTLLEDDNYILASNRPIKDTEIMKIPTEKLEFFVDSVLTHKSLNTLLFSTNCKSEIKIINKVTKTLNSNKKIKPMIKSEISPQDIVFRRVKNEAIGKIMIETKNHKEKRKEDLIDMSNKIYRFYNEIKEAGKQIEKNEKDCALVYRKKRFMEIFENIKRKIKEEGLKMPEIHLNTKDVFSRLYYNVVLPFKKEETKEEIKMNLEALKNNKQKPDMNIKNVLGNTAGKEFTLKITSLEYSKCFAKHTGGPSLNIQVKDIDINNKEDDSRSLLQIRDSDGNSFLHRAVNEKLIELVYYLLAKGLDVNAQNNEGDTPLHLAIRNGDKKIIKLLLDYKAEVDKTNNKKENSVEIASLEIRKFFGLESIMVDRLISKKHK